jgi:hypothetical protein
MINTKEVDRIVNEYLAVVDSVVGVYLDATMGFESNLRNIDELQKGILASSEGSEPIESRKASLDSAWIIHGEGEPREPTSVVHHYATQRNFKARNSPRGDNYKFVGNMALITLYQYWEDYFRGRIADAFGVHKNQVLADIFGDLKLIRVSITHHNAIALPEIVKCKLLKWFEPSEPMFIDRTRFLDMIENLQHVRIVVKKSI